LTDETSRGKATAARQPAERLLVWLVRLNGLVLLLALGPILMPAELMRSIHVRLGLGPFPDVPISYYLARSLSATYALHGALTFAMSFDVDRYRPLLKVLVVSNALFGAVMFGIDLAVGMPWFWTAIEGPPIVGYALLIAATMSRMGRVPATQ